MRRIGSTSVEVTTLGLGCAALGNLYRRVKDADAHETLAAALSAGVRYFDTAPYYGFGLSEQRLGEGISSAAGAERVRVSTKIGRGLTPTQPGTEPALGFVDPLPNRPYFDYSYDGVMRQVETSLTRLRRSYIDVLLVHDVGGRTHGTAHAAVLRDALAGAFRAARALKDQGVVGAIGTGVNEVEVCQEVLARIDLDVILLAGRYTLLEQSDAIPLLDTCVQRRVSVVIGGPFNSGILAGDAHYDYGRAPTAVIARVQRLEAVCRSHGVALPAAALQFPLAHPVVASVIPSARSASEVRANAAHSSFAIPPGLWHELRAEGLIDERAPTAD